MHQQVKQKFDSYPETIRGKLEHVRTLILDAGSDIGSVEESLKWGEPSYSVEGGSAVRIDWKSKHPDSFAVYFNCQTKLVDTFKELYGDVFTFQDNRAIVFDVNDEIQADQLKHCVELAFRYHSLKNLPLLGA